MTLLSKLFGKASATSPVWLDVGQLQAQMGGPQPPLIVDVRGPDEFVGPLGHIEAARNIPLDQIWSQAQALLDEQRPLVMVCHTDRRSAKAAEQLQQMGAADVSVLRGGMVAWRTRTG